MISVIIPYKEDRGWLHEAIISIRRQTYKNWEIIHSHGDKTQGANINAALCSAHGEYIKILHDDDMLPRHSLLSLIIGIRGYDFVCGDQKTFGEPQYCPEPKVYEGCKPTLDSMLKGNQIYGGTTLYRKDALMAIGGYNETLWTGEEYDLHLRLLKEGCRCNYISQITHLYRLHETNKSYYMGPGEKKKRQEYIRQIAIKHGR